MPLEDIIADRKKKLANFKKAGINPYPQIKSLKQTIGQVVADFAKLKKRSAKVSVAGRIMAKRGHGALAFLDLSDQDGQIQILLTKNKLGNSFNAILDNLDIGDFLLAKGSLIKTKSGEKSIQATTVQLISKSLRPLPEKRAGLKDIEKKYRQRYLDLITNPEAREVFIKRSKIVDSIRQFLIGQNFLEVETPVLQPLAGGTSAQPFKTHHNALDQDFYLRIAPELYLKRLTVAGFDRVFEFAKIFRNEGLDPSHLQEFTMLEFYWAYADYEDLIKLTEDMFEKMLTDVFGTTKIKHQGQILDFSAPWPRVKFFDLLKKETGINLEKFTTENDLRQAIKDKDIKIKIDNKVGFGALADELYKKVIRPKLVGPVALLDYPKEMIPLAKSKPDEPRKIATFQLLVNGWELVKAYNELNDPIEQKARFESQQELRKRGDKEAHEYDKDYIEALEYGMPPTAGFGMGIDRLCAMLLDQPSVRDVVFFPMVRTK